MTQLPRQAASYPQLRLTLPVGAPLPHPHLQGPCYHHFLELGENLCCRLDEMSASPAAGLWITLPGSAKSVSVFPYDICLPFTKLLLLFLFRFFQREQNMRLSSIIFTGTPALNVHGKMPISELTELKMLTGYGITFSDKKVTVLCPCRVLKGVLVQPLLYRKPNISSEKGLAWVTWPGPGDAIGASLKNQLRWALPGWLLPHPAHGQPWALCSCQGQPHYSACFVFRPF